MKKRKTIKKQNRFEELLEIPKEISSEKPKLTVMGFEELLIENYKTILEYQDFYIRLSTHIGIININGFELNLNEMYDFRKKCTILNDIKNSYAGEEIKLELAGKKDGEKYLRHHEKILCPMIVEKTASKRPTTTAL